MRFHGFSNSICVKYRGIVLGIILLILHVNHHKNAIQATNKMCPFDLNQCDICMYIKDECVWWS